MFLRKNKSHKTGRTYLSIVRGYQDKDGKNRHKTVMKVGYLDVVKKQFDDPIAHFKQVARDMTREYEEDNKPIKLEISKNQTMPVGTNDKKNFGHIIFSHIYHELKIDYFLNNRRRYTEAQYNHNSIFKMLIYSRLLHPASKKKSFEMKNMFFDKMDFSLSDLYRSLSFFTNFKDEMLLALHKRIKRLHNRDTSLVYYDVTNYYFEIDYPDGLRKKGVSKEHKPNPIVQMGLFTDKIGLPLTYELFPGNMLDKQTLIPMISKIRKKYELDRFIVVADRGMMSGDNIRQIGVDGNGYIISYSIRMANKTFKNYVLDQSGYRQTGEEGFKIKSRVYPREIIVTDLKGKKKKIIIDEKQVVFYSPKYATKAKKDRQYVLDKAQKLIESPAAYAKAASYGAAKYVNDETYSPQEGIIITDARHILSMDEQRRAEEEKFDGYYAIVSNELDLDEEKIIEIYRGLWKIEESFKVTKSDLATRPVYLSLEDHIQAHFLICFVSLLIVRLLQKDLVGQYSVPAILESVNHCTCSLVGQNIYMFDYYDEILCDLGKIMGINFSQKYRSAGEIRKIFGETKK